MAILPSSFFPQTFCRCLRSTVSLAEGKLRQAFARLANYPGEFAAFGAESCGNVVFVKGSCLKYGSLILNLFRNACLYNPCSAFVYS